MVTMKVGGRGFKNITYTLLIIALLLLPAFPTASAPWIRGVATWMTYETHLLKPDRLDLSANVIASLPLEEMQLTYVWEIDGTTVRTGRNTTIYIDNTIQSSVHVRLTVCSERSHSCAVDEQDIRLTNWAVIITVSSLFSILVIGMIFYEERWKKRLRSWI